MGELNRDPLERYYDRDYFLKNNSRGTTDRAADRAKGRAGRKVQSLRLYGPNGQLREQQTVPRSNRKMVRNG